MLIVVPELKVDTFRAFIDYARAHPGRILDRLSAETIRTMRTGEVRDLLGRQGFDVIAGTPAEFSRWITAESAKWSRVIHASCATAE